MKASVAILNDTDRNGEHFGCARVMGFIRANLASREIGISLSVRTGTDWRKDPAMVTALGKADAILVNGEGTLHHGRRKGRWLLDIAAHPLLAGKPKFLVNALWQDNPDDWAKLLDRFDVISARDSTSAAEMVRQTGREVSWFADMSMCAPITLAGGERAGILVGDSVSSAVSASLAGLAAGLRRGGQDVALVPVVAASHFDRQDARKLRTRLRKRLALLRRAIAGRGQSEASYASNVDDYIARLIASSLSVTGRFHSVCLSVATATPFVAVASNSRKIEALVRDAGLDPSRLVDRGRLTPDLINSRDWSYSETETRSIERYLADGAAGAATLFDRIADLTQGSARRS